MSTSTTVGKIASISPHVAAFRSLAADKSPTLASFAVDGLVVEIRSFDSSLWALVRRKNCGGLALRAVFVGCPFTCKRAAAGDGEAARLIVDSLVGEYTVTFGTMRNDLEQLRVTVALKPSVFLRIPYIPRDLYPLDEHDDPIATSGSVEAVQRGLNVGIVYFRVDEPAFGSVLYFQNLTALNDYFLATGTKPEDVIGGVWPELGYLPPTHAEPAGDNGALKPGVAVTISDVVLVFRPDAPSHERDSARRFLQMLGAAYKLIDRPSTEYHDWIERSERTLRDLAEAPEATVREYGNLYVHPYTAAEYPDSMAQASVAAAIHEWNKWNHEEHPLAARLNAGLPKFYDTKRKTVRRYLPSVGDDKDADEIDSWYLYHPLLNLGIMAIDGDETARNLFLKSLDFGIEAAHHFEYKWPVKYRIDDFSVIVKEAAADGRGQTDVGSIYAWVMLQAFQLTDDKRYLDEARAAIDAAIGLRFDINYQANLTAWGAAACARLWRITNRDVYLEQSYVYLASFFHNSIIWESQLGDAVHYPNFLGVTCLQDAPYMAMYECFDSFVAFERYLNDSGPELEPAARMLISEYCKYALTRAWYYYPDTLPPEAIAPKQRENNGHVDRKLSFPLEDLYPDGQPAGQVGQEVYGAGAAFIFATRSFHQVEEAPFMLYCNQFIRAIERTGEGSISVNLDGGETCTADFSLVRVKRRRMPKARLATIGGDPLRPHHTSPDRIDFHVPASGRLVLTWD